MPSPSAPSTPSAVGAAAAAVGIIVGVVTLTGTAFKFAIIIVWRGQWRQRLLVCGLLPFDRSHADRCSSPCVMTGGGLHPDGLRHADDGELHHHGDGRRAGARPARRQRRSWRISSSSITACSPTSRRRSRIAAYAAASMAGADPFRTGNTAFRLALGKVLVLRVRLRAGDADRGGEFAWWPFITTYTTAAPARRDVPRASRLTSAF